MRPLKLLMIVLTVGAFISAAVFALSWFSSFPPFTEGMLTPGARAVLIEDFSAAPADQAITGLETGDKHRLKWGVTPKGDILVTSGSHCIVKLDPAWDEDSCYPDRPVAVQLSDGRHQGKTVALPRNLLH